MMKPLNNFLLKWSFRCFKTRSCLISAWLFFNSLISPVRLFYGRQPIWSFILAIDSLPIQLFVKLLDRQIVACEDSWDFFHLLHCHQHVVSALKNELVDSHIAKSSVEAAEEMLALFKNVFSEGYQLVAQFEHLLALVFSLSFAIFKVHEDFATVSINLFLLLVFNKELIWVDVVDRSMQSFQGDFTFVDGD